MSPLRLQVILQVLDWATTLVCLHLGFMETNPLVGVVLAYFGAVQGLTALKLVGIAVAMKLRRRGHVLIYLNWFYAVIVAANILAIIQKLFA